MDPADAVQQTAIPFSQLLISLALRVGVAILILLILFWLATWLSRIVRRVLTRRNIDPSLVTLFERITRWGLTTLGVLTALETLGIHITGIIASLGIAAFTIGFALQDIAKNFMAGVLLILQRPFAIGDVIEVKGYGGTVMDVSLRATELLSFDGLCVLIPNADVFINPITNFSRRQQRRLSLSGSVAYGADLEAAGRVLSDAISQVSGLAASAPAPTVIFNQLADSAIKYTVYYWIDLTQTDVAAAQDQGLRLTQAAMTQANIARA